MNVPLAFRCSESWDAMTPTGGGRHCVRCRKDVIDLDTLGPLQRRLALLRPRRQPPCVKFTRRPARAARLPAVVAMLASLCAASPAMAEEVPEVHVCSSDADSGVIMLGGYGGRAPTLLARVLPRGFRGWVRRTFSRPSGYSTAHVATTQEWRKVTVRCDSAQRPRRVDLDDGSAMVDDLPGYETCTVRFHGTRGVRDQDVEFRVNDTTSEALTAAEAAPSETHHEP